MCYTNKISAFLAFRCHLVSILLSDMVPPYILHKKNKIMSTK